MKLYGYWRSSSAWRVRIALALKGIAFENVPVHLARAGGEQFRPEFMERNPMAQVPVLEFEDAGRVIRLSQSVAIIEYLEEICPEPPLLPRAPIDRARVRQLVELVNAGIQPLQNRLLLEHVAALGGDRAEFAREFIGRGLLALESYARSGSSRYLASDSVTVADVYLVPQMFNARRFGVPLEGFPTLVRVDAACGELEAFRAAHPERQPDAEPA